MYPFFPGYLYIIPSIKIIKILGLPYTPYS